MSDSPPFFLDSNSSDAVTAIRFWAGGSQIFTWGPCLVANRLKVAGLMEAASPEVVRAAGFSLADDGRIRCFQNPDDPGDRSSAFAHLPWWAPILWTLAQTCTDRVPDDVVTSSALLDLFGVPASDELGRPRYIRPHIVLLDVLLRRVLSVPAGPASSSDLVPSSDASAAVLFLDGHLQCRLRLVDDDCLARLRAAPALPDD